jgi:fructokinase
MLPAGKQIGGAPANFAYHANALGADGVVVSQVGKDDLGREIIRRLNALGLETRYVATDASHPTGRVDVRLDARGVPDYVIHEPAAWDFITADAELRDLAYQTAAVCFGTLAMRSPVSREAIRTFLRSTRPNCLRVFDINLRQAYHGEEVVRELLAISSILKLNDAELPVVARMLGIEGGPREVAHGLMDRYPLRLVALTRGPRGSALFTRTEASDHPGIPGPVADTVGAGDAFTAALVMGLLDGHDLDHINGFANRLAAYVCSQPGAMPPIPDELLASR